jgi:hypothetical protein
MGRVALRVVTANARLTAAARFVLLIGVGLALGACSKCDVPDFTHWGAPHACDDAALAVVQPSAR